ncbi:MAG: hypothetical protein SOY46_07510 [Butyrivibrio crossotus]|nr:hypothetical protein [Butyrivibrio crossotus]
MKKGLFKKILVAMMCIALTLGMAACGSKKVKVGTGENQSSEDAVKGSKSADDLVKAVAANKEGLENFTLSFDVKLDADLDLKQVLIMQGMTEEMIESAIKEGELEESDLESSAKAGINGTLKICDEAGYAEGKSYAEIPDISEDSQELKSYLVKEGNTTYVYEYDFDDEEWMKEESDTSLSDVIASLRNVTAITDFIKTADVVSEKNGIYTVEAKLDFDKIIGDKEDDIKSAIEDSLSGLGEVSEEDFDLSKIIDLLEDVAITVTIDGDNDTITAISIDLKSCIGKILEVSSTEDVNVKDLLSINEASVTLEFSDFGKTKVELPDEIKDVDDSDDSDDKKDEEETTPDKDDVKPSKEDDKKDDSDVSEKSKYEIEDYDGNVIGKVNLVDGFTVDEEYTDENCFVMETDDVNIWVTVFTEEWVEAYIDGEEWEVDKDNYEYDKVEKLKDTLDTPNGTVEFYKRTFKGVTSLSENAQYCAVITKDNGYFLSFDMYQSDTEELGMTIQEVAEAIFG